VVIAIVSTWDKSSFVFGNPTTGQGQLIGHARTGWYLARDEINQVFAKANQYMLNAYNDRIEALGQRATIGRLKRV
jgi:hypothetical protein